MRPTEDDTTIPGQILGAAARTVGAAKAAAFEVYRQEADTYAIELRTYRAYDGSDPLTAQETAEGLRRFVIPCLVEGKDKVFELSEGTGLGARQFVLIVLIRDQTKDVRIVGAFLVNCQFPWQAEQRLKVVQNLSIPDASAGGETGYRDPAGS
jgi:hypothetical protein